MRIRVSKAAERELDKIFVYWAQRAGVEVADRLIDSIEERFVVLGDFPDAGRKSDEIAPGVFRFPAGKYLIYYRKVRSMIHVLHVFHGARDQSRAFTPGPSK
jgi:plasmid stabilization system protein ParE